MEKPQLARISLLEKPIGTKRSVAVKMQRHKNIGPTKMQFKMDVPPRRWIMWWAKWFKCNMPLWELFL